MSRPKTYSRYTREAVALLSKQIQLGRRQRRWTEAELAERAGISRATLQKIEKGSLGCAIGLVFEVATLVGVRLLDADSASLAQHLDRVDDKLAVLPRAVRKPRRKLDDDF